MSVVTRDEVGAYKPYLWEQSVFEKGAVRDLIRWKMSESNYNLTFETSQCEIKK